MKPLRLLPLLALLVAAAAPATRPAEKPGERTIVNVRSVEVPAGTALDRPQDAAKLKDARERSSLQVAVQTGQPFETIAMVNGVTYRLAGRGPGGGRMQIDKSETSALGAARDVRQVTSNLVLKPDEPALLGWLRSPDGQGSALVITLKQP
jgi:hypothetical protein